MNQKICGTCAHYYQHYTFDKRKIFQVHCGHCAYQKKERNRPDAKICEHYAPSGPSETPFVSKEYLSKVLLEYMLKLQLLSEIGSSGEDVRFR